MNKSHERWVDWTVDDLHYIWGRHIQTPFKDAARSAAAGWLAWFAEGVNSVLDVGCGGGIAGLRLKQLKPELLYHGIDISQDIIETASKITDISLDHFSICNIRDLIHWNQKFDAVLVSHILEHHPRDSLVELADSIIHVASKYIVVVMFNMPNDNSAACVENLGQDGFYSNTYSQFYLDFLFTAIDPFHLILKKDFLTGNDSQLPERLLVYQRK